MAGAERDGMGELLTGIAACNTLEVRSATTNISEGSHALAYQTRLRFASINII